MNTRLQVEHPVTEAITGLDLVEWQLRIARGEPIPLQQADIRWQGHAIEARLCAEDAFNGFAPQAGRIAAWQVPAGEGIRVDHGMVPQPTIPPYYDSMVAKVIAYGVDREQARGRLLRALAGSSVLGLVTNRDHLLQALGAPAFATPKLATRWLGEASLGWAPRRPDARWAALAAVIRLHRLAQGFGPYALWSSAGLRETPMRLASGEQLFDLRMAYRRGEPIEVRVGDASFAVEVQQDDGLDVELIVDGLHLRARCSMQGDSGWLDAEGCSAAWADLSQAPPERDDEASHGIITSRMHGALVRLNVEVGQRVAKGDFVLAIEAMKMEHRIEAPIAGTVVEVGAAAGTQVAPGRLLVRIEADAA
jgi:geranyl-CoA carboxylase alpha subunit